MPIGTPNALCHVDAQVEHVVIEGFGCKHKIRKHVEFCHMDCQKLWSCLCHACICCSTVRRGRDLVQRSWYVHCIPMEPVSAKVWVCERATTPSRDGASGVPCISGGALKRRFSLDALPTPPSVGRPTHRHTHPRPFLFHPFHPYTLCFSSSPHRQCPVSQVPASRVLFLSRVIQAASACLDEPK